MAVDLGKTISLKDLLEIVFRRKWVILGVFALVLAVGAAYTLAQARIYEASSKVLIKKQLAEPVLPASEALLPTVEDIKAEKEIIQSNLLIKDVVEQIQPELSQDEEDVSYAVNEFKRNLAVVPIEDTGFVGIYFRAEDAAYAAKAVNTLTDVYLEKRGEIYQITGALDFIRQQTAEADERLRQSQEQLQAYQRDADLYFVNEQKGSMLSIMSQFEVELQNTNVAIAEQNQQIAALKAATTPEGEGFYLGGTQFYDATADAIKGKLADLEMERNKQLQVFRPDSRRMKSLDTEIALARKSLIEAQRGAAEAQLKQANIELQQLIARRSIVAGRIGQLKGQIIGLEQKGYEFGRLSQQVETNASAYETYLQKQEQARMSTAIDKSKILSVGIAEYASIPGKAVSPRAGLNMLVALVVGLVVAFGSAFAREFLDSSLNDPDDVMRELELPVLASLPDFGSGRMPQFHRRRAS